MDGKCLCQSSVDVAEFAESYRKYEETIIRIIQRAIDDGKIKLPEKDK